MTTNDIDAIRNRAYVCAAYRHRWADEVGVDDQDVLDHLRRAKELVVDNVPALCDEVEQLRATANVRQGQLQAAREHADKLSAEVGQLRSEHHTLERLAMDSVITTPLPPDVDQVIAGRPAMPYRSATVDGLSGVTVNGVDGQVVIDGLAHSPAAALELSAAIARAVRETTLGGCRG